MLNETLLYSNKFTFLPSSFLRDQAKLIDDYWSKHTLEEGTLASLTAATEFVQESVQGMHPLIQATAGTGMGVVNLLGGIPLGLYSWGKQVAQELSKGLVMTLKKFYEVPANGFIIGAQYVYAQSLKGAAVTKQIYHGGVYQVNPWEIAYGVTMTLGTAVILVLGAKTLVRGVGAIKAAKVTPSNVADLAKFGKAVGDTGKGFMMMGIANSKTSSPR